MSQSLVVNYPIENKRAGSDILLVGDFNEPFGSDPDGLSFTGELQLVNVINIHPHDQRSTGSQGLSQGDHAPKGGSIIVLTWTWVM